jgi:AraC-type DNA-binding domain-containing proteins
MGRLPGFDTPSNTRNSETACTSDLDLTLLQEKAQNIINQNHTVSPFLVYRTTPLRVSFLLLTASHSRQYLQQDGILQNFQLAFNSNQNSDIAVYSNTHFVFITLALKWLSQRFTGSSKLDHFVVHRLSTQTNPEHCTLDNHSILLPTARDIQFSSDQCSSLLHLESQVLLTLSAIINKLYTNVKNRHSRSNFPATKRKAAAKIKHHLDEYFIKPNTPAPIKLQKIAETLGMSISTAQREFKTAFDKTIIEYVRNQRLEKANNLLRGEMSIGEVAYIAGYNHTANFSIAFKKYFGVSPGDAH